MISHFNYLLDKTATCFGFWRYDFSFLFSSSFRLKSFRETKRIKTKQSMRKGNTSTSSFLSEWFVFVTMTNNNNFLSIFSARRECVFTIRSSYSIFFLLLISSALVFFVLFFFRFALPIHLLRDFYGLHLNLMG